MEICDYMDSKIPMRNKLFWLADYKLSTPTRQKMVAGWFRGDRSDDFYEGMLKGMDTVYGVFRQHSQDIKTEKPEQPKHITDSKELMNKLKEGSLFTPIDSVEATILYGETLTRKKQQPEEAAKNNDVLLNIGKNCNPAEMGLERELMLWTGSICNFLANKLLDKSYQQQDNLTGPFYDDKTDEGKLAGLAEKINSIEPESLKNMNKAFKGNQSLHFYEGLFRAYAISLAIGRINSIKEGIFYTLQDHCIFLLNKIKEKKLEERI